MIVIILKMFVYELLNSLKQVTKSRNEPDAYYKGRFSNKEVTVVRCKSNN